MTSCSSVKPLMTKMTCPFCQTSFAPKDVKDYNDSYVRCPNTKCMVSFIPRSSELKHRLLKILLRFVVIECTNTLCNTEYYAHCVLHNEFYSVCPNCETKNSHDADIRANARIFSDSENETFLCPFSKCEVCDGIFDSTYLPQKKHDYDCVRFCRDCFSEREDDYRGWCGMGYDINDEYCPINNYYWRNGSPIEKISICDYPRFKVDEFSKIAELTEIVKQYLPTIPSEVRDAKTVTVDPTISKNSKKKTKK